MSPELARKRAWLKRLILSVEAIIAAYQAYLGRVGSAI